jgi:6-pyruvoyltetrahydropterin/6-carboxytetrahydropterin synthase
MDLKEIKDIAEKHILSRVDHKNLTLDVDFMKGLNPTTEIMAIKFWEILYPLLKRDNASLYEITLYETERQWVSYKGE